MFWKSHWGKLLGKVFPVFELMDHGSHLEVGHLSDKSGKLPGLQEQWSVTPFWWFVSRELQILLGMGTRWTSLCLLSVFCSSRTDLAYFRSVLCLSRCQGVLVRSQMAPTLCPFLECHCSRPHLLPFVRAFLESFSSLWGLSLEVGCILFLCEYVGGPWIERSICMCVC